MKIEPIIHSTPVSGHGPSGMHQAETSKVQTVIINRELSLRRMDAIVSTSF